MKIYYVFYDANCPLCRRIRGWLESQPQRFHLHLMARNDPAVERRFPGLGKWFQGDELVVVSSAGEVWAGAPAWITILYSLEDHWEWSFRLASTGLQHSAFAVIDQLSKNRQMLSGWFDDVMTMEPVGQEECSGCCMIGRPPGEKS